MRGSLGWVLSQILGSGLVLGMVCLVPASDPSVGGKSLLQEPAPAMATVQAEYTNPGLTPSHWVMTIHPDGSGQFDSDGMAVTTGTAMHGIEAWDVHRPIQLSEGFLSQVFATARDRKLFAFPCESHMKVAFQGTKRLSYSGPEGSGACEFNYSKDKQIESLGTSLVAVGSTILSGARMEKLLQHDRLGLDAELDALVGALHDGNAMEVGTISETLTRIAADEQVMDRARKKARLLLTQAR
jgi:hypothetical protein